MPLGQVLPFLCFGSVLQRGYSLGPDSWLPALRTIRLVGDCRGKEESPAAQHPGECFGRDVSLPCSVPPAGLPNLVDLPADASPLPLALSFSFTYIMFSLCQVLKVVPFSCRTLTGTRSCLICSSLQRRVLSNKVPYKQTHVVDQCTASWAHTLV